MDKSCETCKYRGWWIHRFMEGYYYFCKKLGMLVRERINCPHYEPANR